MLQLSVFNRSGEQVDTIEIDEQLLGGIVKKRLLRDAVIMYEANKRIGCASSRSRGQINRSGAKMYRQKGTGRARHATTTVPGMRGGAKAFGPKPRDYSYRMPRKALRAAFLSALLAKIIDNEVVVIDELAFEQPKTKELATIMGNLKINGSCLIAIEEYSEAAYKSARNLHKVDLKVATNVNAYDLLLRKQLLITRAAVEKIVQRQTSKAVPATTEAAE